MRRWVFRSAAGLSLLLCLLSTLLWLRGHFQGDAAIVRLHTLNSGALSGDGQLCLFYMTSPDSSGIRWEYQRQDCSFLQSALARLTPPPRSLAGFALLHGRGGPNNMVYGLALPHWAAILLFAALPAYWLHTRPRRQRLAGRARCLCEQCGYDLRATTTRCPECGTPVPEGHVAKVAP